MIKTEVLLFMIAYKEELETIDELWDMHDGDILGIAEFISESVE